MTGLVLRLAAAAALSASALLTVVILILTAGYVGALPDAAPLSWSDRITILALILAALGQLIAAAWILAADPRPARRGPPACEGCCPRS